MSNEALSNDEYCKKMQECYPPLDLKRLGLGLLGVAVVFIISALVLYV